MLHGVAGQVRASSARLEQVEPEPSGVEEPEQTDLEHRIREFEERERLLEQREYAADRRDRRADERDRRADERSAAADERERIADERELIADHRERLADERELQTDEREVRVAELELRADTAARSAGLPTQTLEERSLEAIERSRGRLSPRAGRGWTAAGPSSGDVGRWRSEARPSSSARSKRPSVGL